MLESRRELSEEESRAIDLVNSKGSVLVYKNDPNLPVFESLAKRGLFNKLKALDHPNSLVVTFTKIEQVSN